MIIFEMVVSLIIQFGVIVIKVVLIQPYLFFNLMICKFFPEIAKFFKDVMHY